MAMFSNSRFSTGKSFNEKKRFDTAIKIEDLIDIYKFPSNKKWQRFRIIGGFASYAHWWLPLVGGKTGKLVNVPKQSLNWDPSTEEFDASIPCPYEAIAEKLAPMFPSEGKNQNRNAPRPSIYYYVNAIVRADEDPDFRAGKLTKAESESGYKDIDNGDSRTPVRVLRLPPGLASKVAGLAELNLEGNDQMSVADVEFGCDISILFDDDQQGAAKYQAQLRERSPLTETEMGYLMYNLEGLLVPESYDTAKDEAQKIYDSHFKGRGEDNERGGRPAARRGAGDEFGSDEGERRPVSRRSEINEFSDEPPARRAAPAAQAPADDDTPPPRREAASRAEQDDAPPARTVPPRFATQTRAPSGGAAADDFNL